MHLLHHRGGRKIHRVGIYLPERSNNGTPHRVIATNYRILNIKSKKLVIFVKQELKIHTIMKEEDKSKLIEVFKGSLWEAQLVKSLLGNNDIESTLKDGMVVNVVLPDTAIDVAVLVNEANYETAMEVVRAYEKKEEGD
nr:MAG TPA: Putative prokaryotic signal transducing protein [Caudoviricetes sp.]